MQAVVKAMNKWRHYLLRHTLTSTQTMRPSQTFLKQPSLTPRQACWVQLYSDYDFNLFHAPRKDNFAVDALSHRPDYVIASDNPSLSAYGTWIRAHLHAVPQKQISKSVTLGPAAALAPSWLLLGASQPRSGHRAAKNTPWLPLAMTPLILSTAFQSEIFWFLQQALWKQLVMQDTLRHFRLPRVLVSERDPRFTSNFWKALCKRLGTSLNISTSHHPQTGGQTKCANRTNEDMLRAYVSPQQSDWHEHLIAA